MKKVPIIAAMLTGALALAQAPAEPSAPAITMRQLMLDLIHPASNEILLQVNRGGPKDAAAWASVRRSAVTLAECGNLLTMRGRARDQGDWLKDSRALADAGSAAYQAAQAKDAAALAALTEKLDASCTNCHKQYRKNVFPPVAGLEGGSK